MTTKELELIKAYKEYINILGEEYYNCSINL